MKRVSRQILASLVAVTLIGIGLIGIIYSTNDETNVRQDSLLIKHGWDIPSATFVGQNSSAMDEMPFNGVVLKMDNELGSRVQSQSPVSYEEFQSSLSPLFGVEFNNLKHNFLIVYSTPAGDIFDDWTVPLDNYAHMAQAAREVGLQGIFFDNEEYFGDALAFPEKCAGDKSVSECRDQAYLRGSQVMDAIISSWPDVELIVAHGPYLSEEATADYFKRRGIPWNNLAGSNEIRGSFTIGLASATRGESAQFIDGGQVYAARTKRQFKAVKHWQKEGMSTRGELIPDDLRPDWPGIVSSSFGVYDKADLYSGVPMDVEIWNTTLATALAKTDKYVWAYTERFDWWNTGHPDTPVPEEWVNATRDALNSSN